MSSVKPIDWVDTVSGLRAGNFTPRELREGYNERLRSWNPTLNAVELTPIFRTPIV